MSLPIIMPQNSPDLFRRNLTAFCLAIFFLAHPFLSPIPGMFYGDLILIFTTVYELFSERSDVLQIHKTLLFQLLLFLSYVIISLATACFQPAFSLYDFIIRTVRWGTYVVCGFFLANRTDFAKLKKYIIAIALLSAVFLLVQVITFRLFGRVLTISIGGKTLGCSIETRYVNGVSQGRIYRFSSFFTEPAHFSYYTAISLVLLLGFRPAKAFQWQEIVCGCILALAMVLSTSTYGFALLGLIGVMVLSSHLWQTRNAASAFLIIVVVFFILIAFYAVIRGTSMYEYLLSKLDDFGSKNRTSFIWQQNKDFPLLFQWLGVGIGNEEYYFAQCYHETLPYMNSISLSFLYCGIVGVVLLALFFVAVWFNHTRNGRMLLLLLAVMSMFSTVFFSSLPTLCTVLMVSGEGYPQFQNSKGNASLEKHSA